MTNERLTRRQFNSLLISGVFAGESLLNTPLSASATVTSNLSPSIKIKAAAIQMTAKMADTEHNMQQAELLIKQALEKGAEWIVLPEMFTSAVAFHPDMLSAIQPLDGPALSLLRDYAQRGNAVIGGSYLASRDGQVFNTFILAFPDGSFVRHDKDLPTYWENCYYRGGSDDGVLETPHGPVGAALCWEMIRSQTATRLRNRVSLLLTGSCWWTLPEDAPADSPNWSGNLEMIRDAVPRMAKMLGVPVIHGSHAGSFEGYFSPDLPDVAYNSMYLGETMIVDAHGKVVARRSRDEGEGVVIATITTAYKPVPSERIPDNFWIPDEMPDEWKSSFERWLDAGADYYQMVTRPFLETGNIKEYEPPYLR